MTENPGRYFGKTLSEMQNESYQHFQEVKNEQADEQSKESETLRKNGIHSVSYTHLTLPTKRIV